MRTAAWNGVAMKKELTIEEAFEELDGILKAMEEDKLPLEKSFEMYKNGMELVKLCSLKLDKVEKKITVLEGNGESGDEL